MLTGTHFRVLDVSDMCENHSHVEVSVGSGQGTWHHGNTTPSFWFSHPLYPYLPGILPSGFTLVYIPLLLVAVCEQCVCVCRQRLYVTSHSWNIQILAIHGGVVGCLGVSFLDGTPFFERRMNQ